MSHWVGLREGVQESRSEPHGPGSVDKVSRLYGRTTELHAQQSKPMVCACEALAPREGEILVQGNPGC